MDSASVSRGGRSRSGGVAALSWRGRSTERAKDRPEGKHTHTQYPGSRTHTHAHRDGKVKREKIKDKRMIQK